MKILHVVSKVDRQASGLSQAVLGISKSQALAQNDVTLICAGQDVDAGNVRLIAVREWPWLGGGSFSYRLAKVLRTYAKNCQIVHNHSLWTFPNIAVGLMTGKGPAKFVFSPHGTLSPWALSLSSWKKRILWPFQKSALLNADLVHATSADELDQIRSAGYSGPIALIPNGVDVNEVSRKKSEENERRTLLFLSRIHVTKGIDHLLQAWELVQDSHPDWDLVIAGRDETSHLLECQKIVDERKLQRVSFPGPLYGCAKAEAYVNAALFVLPSHSENFGLVVAEALAHSCPVIVSKGAPWARVVDEGCGWWTANSVEDLASTLDDAMSCSVETLSSMGERGRLWVNKDYSWNNISTEMIEVYRWLLEGGEAPACVNLS